MLNTYGTLIENIPQYLKKLMQNMTNFIEYSLGESCTTSEHHMLKVFLNSFHLNGNTSRFHPKTLKLEPPYTA